MQTAPAPTEPIALYQAAPSAYIDRSARIGSDSAVWHFARVLAGVRVCVSAG